MRLLLVLLAITGLAQTEHPRTYLLSLRGIPLKDTESISGFSISTWGVEFDAVCRLPSGWKIKVGASATPDGVLEGEGSQGTTWFNKSDPPELRNFVLLTLYDKVQRNDIREGDGIVPATFHGLFKIQTDDGIQKRTLTYQNILLRPSGRCPPG